ncbi:MAG TPA: peptide chain release factor 1, partial [Nanoarchaeota archaeon]|nr:peptide chain release factor 1 [Nanoarchaeota archaeon]
SGVPGKIKAGGQSAARFERLTESLAKEFFKRVAIAMKEIFFDMPKLKGIIVGGPIPTKEEFLEYGELVTKLKEKVIAVKDIGYTDEHGLKLLVEKTHSILEDAELTNEKNILRDFFTFLGKNKDKVAYGEAAVRRALEVGSADKLLISEDFDDKNPEVSKEFQEMAKSVSAEVIFVSVETEEGQSFRNLSGIAAFLRFAI